MKTAALVFLAGWQLGAALDIDVCGPATNADYHYEVIPTDGFTISWIIDEDDESISFEVVSAAAAWTSIGFSSDGMMVGSDAVVGLPNEASVLEYDLTEKSLDAVVPSDAQEISSSSVSQDASGETTLTFTRPLSPGGDKQTISSTPGDTAIFIYSYGTDNTLAYHGPALNRGSVVVDPFCGDASVSDGTPAPTAVAAVVETLIPTPADSASSTEAPAASEDEEGSIEAPEDGTPAPTVASSPVRKTRVPSLAGEEAGQGGSDGAFRVGRGGWVAMAATGIVMIVGVLAL